MQAHVCAYTAQAQTRDLRYISIWQSINTVIEYRIMMQCLVSIKMVICMFQKIAAHDLTSFSTVLVAMCVFSEQ